MVTNRTLFHAIFIFIRIFGYSLSGCLAIQIAIMKFRTFIQLNSFIYR